MEEECEVEEIFAEVPSIDLDPGQVNLLLSSLNSVSQMVDAKGKEKNACVVLNKNSRAPEDVNKTLRGLPEILPESASCVLTVSPLFPPTPPPLSSDLRLYHCSQCDFFSLSREACSKHESLNHPAPRPTIQCISCPNIFLSLQALKVHLLLDHEVLKTELQSILLLTLKKCEEFLISSTPLYEGQKPERSNVETLVNSPNSISCFDPKLTSNVPPSEPHVSKTETSNTTFTSVVVNTSKSNAESQLPSVSTQDLNNGESLDSRLPLDPAVSSTEQHSFDISSDSESEEESDDLETFSGCSDEDELRSIPSEEVDEVIIKHLQSMEQLKKEKLKAKRCLLDNCQSRFKSFNTMEYHKKCHHKSGWKCPECSLIVSSWHSFALHLWNSHTIDMELYFCNFCNFRTDNLSHLRTSHIWIHGKRKMFSCSTCSKPFKTKKQLRNHQVIHKKEKSTVRYECQKCKALFSKCLFLRQHYDAVHCQTKRYRCGECGHRSASRSSQALHLRTHTKEKKYACGECCYRTNDHNALRRHSARHSGVRPYSCPHCSYSSINSTSLLAHVESKHPGMLGDVVFSCPLCPFKTLRKEIFLGHASKHSFPSPTALKQIQLGLKESENLTVQK